MSDLLTLDQYKSDYYMQSTGTMPEEAVQVAIDMAEGAISAALGYPMADDGSPTFVAYQDTEEWPWPWPNRAITLMRPRIIAVDSVLALHDYYDCDCDWTELTGCAFVYDARLAVIKVRSCEQASSCWHSCDCPHRVRVAYTSGFAAADVVDTTPLGRRLRMAIALQAASLMRNMDHYTEGTVAIKSWSSLGYSETRDLLRSAAGTKLGQSILSQQAADLLNPLLIRRKGPVIIRGH